MGRVFILAAVHPACFQLIRLLKFLSAVRARLDLRPDVEITLEANPGTIEHDSFYAYAQAGINRVSLGVQSFDMMVCLTVVLVVFTAREEIEQSLQSLKSAGIS